MSKPSSCSSLQNDKTKTEPDFTSISYNICKDINMFTLLVCQCSLQVFELTHKAAEKSQRSDLQRTLFNVHQHFELSMSDS